MAEPQASEFRSLVRQGAGARDIHGGRRDVGFAKSTTASDAFVAREVARVETHRRSSCPLLEAFTGPARRILDVGCSTGGSTVALALSKVLRPELVVGVDPERLSLRAAEARARGYGLDPRQVAFIRTPSGHPLPFANDSFDLVTCVSVLEFVPTHAQRRRLVQEMKRVARPDGHVFLATPSPFRVRETHSKRWFGNVLRREGYPWATPPWTLDGLFTDCERVRIEAWLASRALERAGLAADTVPSPFFGALAWTLARTSEWQKVLVRKPAASAQMVQ